jgi:hypothetical protein
METYKKELNQKEKSRKDLKERLAILENKGKDEEDRNNKEKELTVLRSVRIYLRKKIS